MMSDGRPALGVHLRDAAPLVEVIKKAQIEGYEILNLAEGKPRPGRVTVYICNHGPVLWPLPAPALTVDALLKEGGFEDLVAVTLFHWVLELNPLASAVLTRYFGHSTRELRSVAGLIRLMKERRFDIVGTAPEGRSSGWSYDEAPFGPFTRRGLLVAALEADADVILTAQRGVERFGVPLRFPFGARLPFDDGPRGLLVSWWIPGRRAFVTIKYRRYQPRMSAAQRATLSPGERRAQIDEEIARMHAQLTALYQSYESPVASR